MKKTEELCKEIEELIKETKLGRIHWEVKYQTTEYNDKSKKLVVEEDGEEWTVDECYTSYYCQHKGTDFLLITYEMIHTTPKKQKTTNLVFAPPLGIRYFDIHALLPYAIETDQMLVYHVHLLWSNILELKKANSEQLVMDVDERILTLEDDIKEK